MSQECLRKQLFGLPAGALPSMVDSIGPSTKIYLYNFDTKQVRGAFKPDGQPRMNIDRTAWTGGM